MKNAIDAGSPLVVLTASDNLYFIEKEMKSDEFQKAFQVDQSDGKKSKVLLGFKLRTTIKFSDLKKKLMHTHLVPSNLFLRKHSGGFRNRVKTFTFGFMRKEHPDHPDIQGLNLQFAKVLSDAWRNLDREDRKKWRPDLPTTPANNSGHDTFVFYQRASGCHP